MRLRLRDQGRKVREAWEHFRSHASQRHDSLKSTFPETTSLLHTHTHTHDLIFWLCRLESLHVLCIPPCDLTPQRVNSTSAGLFFLTGISVSVIQQHARVSTRKCSSMRDGTTINVTLSHLYQSLCINNINSISLRLTVQSKSTSRIMSLTFRSLMSTIVDVSHR